MTMDPRMTPSNGRVAHVSLEGQVEAERFVTGRWMMVQQPMVNITDAPRGARVSQLLFGERFLALETADGFSFGMAERDGYVGYILSGALTGAEDATHWVVAPATHLYPKPDLKAPPDVALFFGSQVRVAGERDGYLRIQTGHYIPQQHLVPMKARFSDPVGVADLFLGTPYLWGGTSRWGIDCSGLIQAALIACGIDCPRDSDQQEAALGVDLPEDEPLRRGDLVFWKGHVGIMSSETMLLHANAHHMAVAYEPLDEALARIGAREFGAVTARKRLPL
ncbi:C40 family peptidase [Roseicyclus persicicus]|uniref:C40 family peptidase n=1 Tax=Roseicyclus persicicus TaxID=2650661 RepID=A0A7X6JYY6_9RHOB|nr:C40 family peptidase [Roseibacterium persicicum]NKX44984.1 C40 family peptidase [Roseibacterium persicicum]